MIDLQNILSDKLKVMMDSGKFDEIVEKELVQMITSATREIFSSYGDISKKIQSILKEQIKIDFSKVDFDTYNHNLSLLVKTTIERVLTEKGLENTKKAMEDILQDVPEMIKISELIKHFKDEINEEESGEITFHYKEETGHKYIAFDKEPEKKWYGCDYRLSIYKDKISTVWLDGKELKNNLILGGLFGFEAELFKLYSAGTIIEWDPENVETYYGDDNA